jgi:hypothetical protein
MPESGNKYFTENLPSGTVIFANLKILCWPLLLLVMTTLAKKFFTGSSECRFCTLNLSSVGIDRGFIWYVRKLNFDIV